MATTPSTSGSQTANADEKIVQFILDTSRPVPEDVLDNVRKCSLDFLGNACFAAKRSERKDALIQGLANVCIPVLARAVEGQAGHWASVIGLRKKYNYTYAALLNGALAHSLDFDDTSAFGYVHPGTVVFPAVLAAGELLDAEWADVIDAAAIGVEIACRVGAAVGPTAYDRGFHVTPIGGIFGAVAGVGRLKRLSSDKLSSALALAGSQAAGSMQYLANGAWNKCLHPGFAAHDALVAIGFAEAGVLGASDPLTGEYGVLASYSNAPRPELLTDRLGEWWAAGDVAIKPYPSCRLTHGAIEAAFALRFSRKLAPSPQDRLALKISPKAFQIVGGDAPNKRRPSNIVDAQFSAYFQCAVAWLNGTVTLDSYDLIDDPSVVALMSNMNIESDEAILPFGAELVVEGDAPGAISLEWPSGEPQNPIEWDGVNVKFAGLAGPFIGTENVDRITDFVRSTGPGRRVRQLLDIMAR